MQALAPRSRNPANASCVTASRARNFGYSLPFLNVWRNSSGRELNHVLPRRMAKLDHILIPQLHVPSLRHRFFVQRGPIATLKVDNIWPDLADLVTEFISFLNVSKLDDSVLLRATRMFQRVITHRNFSPKEPA